MELVSKKRKLSKTAQSLSKENKKYKVFHSYTNIPKLVRLPEDRPRTSEDNHSFCKVCNVEILCHKSAIEKHSQTSKNKNNISQNFKITHTLCPLLENIFSNSSVAKNLMLKRTKATALISESLGENVLNDLYSRLRAPGFFYPSL